MTPERWARIKEVFGATFERPEAEQSTFLDSACDGDAELRAEVERLLKGGDEPSLHSPASGILNAAAEPVPGDTVGPYRIESRLGEGGMGVVYKANDTRLGRSVALKFVNAQFSARFDREARVISSLNHPHICTLFDVGPNYLVMELVEGPTLADRIKGGALPFTEALGIARQVADALEAAHEKGVVHRDLKPANIKVKPDGTVKVLDFGLAKMAPHTAPGEGPEGSSTPTTHPGVVLGTAAYMSPEQARGNAVDKRTDIWALGCVLYEMLTGQRAFFGETITDTLAAILTNEPDWKRVPIEAQRLLRSCLEKSPRLRLRDIGDAWSLLEDKNEVPSALLSPSKTQREVRWLGLGLLVTIVSTGFVVWYVTRTTTSFGPTMHVTIPLTTTQPLLMASPFVLSPDGLQLIYTAGEANYEAGERNMHLYLRSLDRATTTAIRGTDRGFNPFFSPDGQWVGFFADGKLEKVPITGGTPQTICDLVSGRTDGVIEAADWARDNNIFFTTGASGLWRVPASGGTPELATTLETKAGELSHLWPQVLPSGREVLFTVQGPNPTDFHIAVESLISRTRLKITEKGSYARYVGSGHLVYTWEGSLVAAPFDLKHLKLTGPEFAVVDNLPLRKDGLGLFALSDTGTLIYAVAGPAPRRTLVSVDRRGRSEALTAQARSYASPRLSPDTRKIAVEIDSDIWIYDMARDVLTRLTYDGTNCCPEWTRDGQRLVFSGGADNWNLLTEPVDGRGKPEPLIPSENPQWPGSVSPDGHTLIFMEFNAPTKGDIWMLSLDAAHKRQALIGSASTEWGGWISPDGRWLAYISDETGRFEVYVASFPPGKGKWQISTEGGTEAMWSRNGRELFYRAGAKMMSVSIEAGAGFSASKPREMFAGYMRSVPGASQYDVFPDGKRFVMVKSETELEPTHLNLVINWVEELRTRGTGKRAAMNLSIDSHQRGRV